MFKCTLMQHLELPVYREEAFRKVFAYGAENRIMFGSDSTALGLSHSAEVLRQDIYILRDKLGFPQEIIEKYLGLNALKFLGLRA